MGARETLDAAALREVMARFEGALAEHRDELNSLNVYPVPDGDTGTNMLLTQRAVAEEAARMGSASMAELGTAIARASLLAARGNSGVILAQALRGLTDELSLSDRADGPALARALERASDEARRAVARPVDGTVLSVLADAASAAREALGGDPAPARVAEGALEAARSSLERTRETLPELRAAGVVDAGGRGMLLLFDALASVLAGHDLTEAVGPPGPVGHVEAAPAPVLEFRYEVMYLVDAGDEAVPALTERLGSLGDSLVVVGGAGMFKVHVHTNEPGEAVEAALDSGRPRDIRIVDLEDQVAEHCVAGQARAVRVAGQQASALVAVADGDGLARIFSSLGAVVVRGGPGNNPAVGDLVEAIAAAPADAVLVLPNHRNVVPAAERAAEENAKQVRVIPTRSIPEGLAAAAAFNPLRGADENEVFMRDAASGAAAAEITRAVRDADTPAGPVRTGQWLGAAGGAIRETGDDPAAVAAKVVVSLRTDVHEILTLVVGSGASAEDAASVEAALREALPGLEVEVHEGGQPGYPFLIGLE